MKADVVVVGGGPAGMMAAASAALYGADVLLLEKNPKLGRKLMITGKGRCNVTNHCDVQEFLQNIPTNPRFLQGALHRFTPQDTMDLFERLGVPLKTERGRRVFPQSDRAVDIVDAMRRYVQQSGVRIHADSPVQRLVLDGQKICGVELKDGSVVQTEKVILATGGLSYPLTGSTGDGYRFAQQAGHTIVQPRASLVPIETKEDWCRYA